MNIIFNIKIYALCLMMIVANIFSATLSEKLNNSNKVIFITACTFKSGGLYYYDGTIHKIDDKRSTGITLINNEIIVRVVQKHTSGELLIYEKTGLKLNPRIRTVGELHDVLWDGNNLKIVSAYTNELITTTLEGAITHRQKYAQSHDAWHLNCIGIKDNEVYLSAFGRYTREKEWRENLQVKSGFVMNSKTGEDILQNLLQPHNPTFVDNSWLVCNSLNRELLRFDAEGKTILQSSSLDGFIRGLALLDDTILVGESRRHGFASIAVLDRESLKLKERIEMPCPEIYGILIVPQEFLPAFLGESADQGRQEYII